MKKTLLSLALVVSFAASAVQLPNPKLTPGALNPAVTQSTIHQTVCKSGWTATIRPSVSYTNAIKKKMLKDQKLSGTVANYQLDHAWSLELGGNPTDTKNMWMQPIVEAHMKDQLENLLKRKVCNGSMTLDEAQKAEMPDWYTTYKKYFK